MRAIPSAIVVMAGAVLFAIGALADSVVASGQHPFANNTGMLSMVIGGFAGQIGLGVMIGGRRDPE